MNLTTIGNKLRGLLTNYMAIVWTLVALQLILRVMEYLSWCVSLSSTQLELFFARSVNFDSLFVLLYSFYLLPFYLLIGLINKRFAIFLIKSVALVFFLLILVLTFYFFLSKALLTASVFQFKIAEILQTVLAEINLSRWAEITVFTLFIFLTYVSFFRFKFRVRAKGQLISIGLYLLLCLVALGNAKHQFKSIKYFNSVFDFQIGNSKAVYFLESFNESELKAGSFSPTELGNVVARFQSDFNGFEFKDNTYPLIHSEEYKNVLGPYFPKSSKKPNLVFVVTESLSSTFVGKTSVLGELMPFTDSLMQESLYWPNFLALADRSFGVLPGLLASSVNGVGDRGFINMRLNLHSRKRYPNQYSLIDILKNNQYATNYYYGGWKYFDDVGFYLEQLGVESILGDEDFDDSKYTKPNSGNGNMVWGYSDNDLFQFSFDKMEGYDSSKPYLNLYQTLTIHSPYLLAPKHYYNSDYLNNRLNGSSSEKLVEMNFPKPELASIFFADDVLRNFFHQYSKRPDFKNTIFVITGDHAVDFHVDDSPFKNYRVPLFIYSPMLIRSKEFNSLNSHLDVLPSLLALLKDNYGLQVQNEKPWLGNGLDTTNSFFTGKTIPLMVRSIEKPQFIKDKYAVWGDEVYSFSPKFELIPISDAKPTKNVKQALRDYNYINAFVCLEDWIWPLNDSVK